MTDAAFLLPLGVVVLGWVLAGGSPGPATLAISGGAMGQGRRAGLALAAGVVTGSACWGISAAMGFSAIMMSNVWIFEFVRYAGAAYLLYLAIKSLRSFWRGAAVSPKDAPTSNRLFLRGLLLHLTNPKAILSWGSVYAIALAPGADASAVWVLFCVLIAASVCIFFGYALLFSTARISSAYARSRRWFELGFGALFGGASLKILTT